MKPLLLLLAVATALPAAALHADPIRIAVAANFSSPMQQLIQRFEASSPHRIVASYGASGKFVSQIAQGAPFDVLLAADESSVQHLIDANLADPDSRLTYAIGQLVLWSADKTRVDAAGKVLASGKFTHLALAQPKLAPYGLAGQQVLQNLNLWPALQSKLIFGENVAQTWQFVDSGNAELGFVALSQVLARPGGSYWRVPPTLYQPIRQQGVILKSAANQAASKQFWQFLKSDEARQLIRSAGYLVPTP
jgi:molybdate transport system substrate-binding protein